jgi:L-iditol 2-dehydrogenase
VTDYMQALVKGELGPGNTAVRTVAVPSPRAGEVQVAPRAVGVCGSDLHTWRGDISWALATPVILGHEMAGEIVAVGPDAAPWQIGDRVVCETNGSSCGHCRMCRTGRPEHCPDLAVFGAHTDGFFAERATVNINTLHRIPDGVSFETASMAEPLAVAYSGLITRGALQLGEHVVVIGAGAIGVFVAQLARAAGAASVTVIGTAKDIPRTRLLNSLGVGDLVVNGADNLPVEVNRRTGGAGVDLVVDAAGVSAAMRTALDVVGFGGRIVKIGWGPQPLQFSLDPVVEKVTSILGSRGHGWLDWERVLSLLAMGRIDADACVGGHYRIDQWQAAFEDMESGRNVKSVVVFTR